MPPAPRSLFWRGAEPFSAELCHVVPGDGVSDLHGVALVALPRGGTEVRYLLRVDDGWHATRLRVEMTGAHVGTLDLVGNGRGAWSVGGERRPDLDGCVDVDLGITPATNTLPIRRLDPPVGVPVATRVAWVRFPDLAVEPDEQTYVRLDERRWVFRSGRFEATLEVDDEGFVDRYGDLWRRISGGEPVGADDG